MRKTFETIKQLMKDSEADLEKFENGNKSAAVRVRKNMLEIGKLTKQMRSEIQEAKTK